MKETGACAITVVVVRCAYGRGWVDMGAVAIALAVVVEDVEHVVVASVVRVGIRL
jgi:hypothetical protein